MKTSRTALNLSQRVVFAADAAMVGAMDACAQRKRISTSAWLRALIADRLERDRAAPVREREAERLEA